MKNIFGVVALCGVTVGATLPAAAQQAVTSYNFNSAGKITSEAISGTAASGGIRKGPAVEIRRDTAYESMNNLNISSGTTVRRECSTIIKSDGHEYLRCR